MGEVAASRGGHRDSWVLHLQLAAISSVGGGGDVESGILFLTSITIVSAWPVVNGHQASWDCRVVVRLKSGLVSQVSLTLQDRPLKSTCVGDLSYNSGEAVGSCCHRCPSGKWGTEDRT